MHRTEFFTHDALDHLPRALDVIRKMGFALHDVQMKAVPGGARVCLMFDGATEQAATIFAERVSVLRGIERFSIRAVEMA